MSGAVLFSKRSARWGGLLGWMVFAAFMMPWTRIAAMSPAEWRETAVFLAWLAGVPAGCALLALAFVLGRRAWVLGAER